MIFTAPKNFKANDVITFLTEVEKAFELKDVMQPNVVFDLSKVQSTNILGILLMYKFIDYTYNNNCFHKLNISTNEYINKLWTKYGFWDLINLYVSNKNVLDKGYKRLNIQVEDNFIIAPQPLLRNDNYSNEVLVTKFLPKIKEYYSFNDRVVSMIFQCLSEVLLNFWEHAVEDTKSILVADGNKNSIEIACADTGNGIISTLGQSFHSENISIEQIIKKSVQKGVTSKKMTDHMGYGLWILNEIARLTNGRLHLYSQGAYFRNDFGKEKSGNCGYWQGTIIYLSLPLINPKTLSDIEVFNSNKVMNELKINWK